MAAPYYTDLRLERYLELPSENPSTNDEQKSMRLVETATSLGFGQFALNYQVDDFPVGKGKKQKDEKKDLKCSEDVKINAATVKELEAKGFKFKQLSRFSTVLKDHTTNYALRQPGIQGFDLVAVQPVDERTLQHCCERHDIDIISLNLLEARLDTSLNSLRKCIGVAVSQGLHFEILYSPALWDSTVKRNILANATTLVSAAKGKNIIISSGAKKSLDLRSPYDVINLGRLFGLNHVQAKAAVTQNCQAAVKHGEARKGSFGVVSVSHFSLLSARDKHIIQSQAKRIGTDQIETGEDKCETKSPPNKKLKTTKEKEREKKKNIEIYSESIKR